MAISCPKHMIFGPCGGVRPDGRCEVHDEPCAFDDAASWSEPEQQGAAISPPLVLADFTSEPFVRSTHERISRILSDGVDVALVGEHQNRPDFPPTQLATILRDSGTRSWVTLTCRDRNRIVLEQELAGLHDVGVDAVLCATGDARGYDVRRDVTQVFDLDGIRLTALARSLGLVAAVPETPSAPPTGGRAWRLLQKQRAVASVAVLNYTPRQRLEAFVPQAWALGVTLPVLAGVPVFTDSRSAAVLDALPGLTLDHDAVHRILADPDPVQAGIAAAVSEGSRLLAVPGVAGVNLSGSASARGPEEGARIKAEVGRRLRAAHTGRA